MADIIYTYKNEVYANITKQAFTGLIAIIPVSVPGSCIQSGGSAIIFVILGLVLDKIGFKRRFFTLEETK